MLSSVFEQFVKDSPISVMAQVLMSRIFAAERMDSLFTKYAQVQYQQDLLFSSQVDLMSLVVCGIQKSVHAAYKARAVDLSVSTTALYNKLSGIELGVSQASHARNSVRFNLASQSIGWRTTKFITRLSPKNSRWYVPCFY